MKHLKTKLITSVMMLLIAALMVSTASYAWFTLSTKPEIKGVKDTVVVNENLEIAKVSTGSAPTLPGAPAKGNTIYPDPTAGDTGNTTWGNLVVRSESGTLRPADLSSSSGTIVTIKTGKTTYADAKTEAERIIVDLLNKGYTLLNKAGTSIQLNDNKTAIRAGAPAYDNTKTETDADDEFVVSNGDYALVISVNDKGEIYEASAITDITVTFKVSGQWFEYPDYMPDGRLSSTMNGIAPKAELYGFGELTDVNDQTYVTFFDTWVRTNMPDQVLDLQKTEANRSAGTGTNNGEGTFYKTDYQATVYKKDEAGKDTTEVDYVLYGGKFTVAKNANISTIALVANDYAKAAMDYVKAVRIAFQDVTPDEIDGATAVKDAKLVVANENEDEIETYVKFTADIGKGASIIHKDTEYKVDADFTTKLIAAIKADDVLKTKFDGSYVAKELVEIDAKVSYKKYFDTDGTNDTTGEVTTTGGEAGLYICELVANEAKMIRTYIYLDGKQVTNASASYYGDKADSDDWGDPNDNGNGGVSVDTGTKLPHAFSNAGTLNVQFQAADVEYSMDGLTEATRHVYTEE